MSAPASPRPYTFSHRPDIQGLRGLAVLLVVMYHAHRLVPGGYVGVDVFFVISGFVIAAGIFRVLDRDDGAFSFRTFYQRRMRRLLPSLSVTVCVTLISAPFLATYSSLSRLRDTGLAATLFHANHALLKSGDYFAPSAERNALLHTWSLSVEEQFYFVFPLLFVLSIGYALRRAKPVYKTVACGMSVLFGISLALELYVSFAQPQWLGANPVRAAFFMAPLRAWEFGAGVLVAIALPWLQSQGTRLGRGVLGWGGLLVILISAVCFTHSTLYPGIAALAPVLGTTCMILAGSLKSDQAQPLLSHRLFTRIGDLSYGWYLWHWAPLVFVQATWPGDPFLPMLCTLPLSLGLAWLNERWIENPLRHAAWTSGRYANIIIFSVCMALPMLGLFGQKLMLWGLGKTPDVAQINRLEKEYQAIGCSSDVYNASGKTCRWGEKEAPYVVALIGDSNARQFIPVLREMVPAPGVQFHAATFVRCPFSDLTPYRLDVAQTKCTDWVQGTMAELERHPPDLVLISSSYDNYLSEQLWSFKDPLTDITHRKRDARVAAMQRSTARLSARLVAAGSQVAFIKNTPKFRGHDAFTRGVGDPSIAFGSSCSLLKLWVFPEACNARRPANQVGDPTWADAAFGREAYRTALGERTKEIIVDPALCPNNLCSARQQGAWVYRDAGHLTPYGARQTRDIFEQFVRKAAAHQSSANKK